MLVLARSCAASAAAARSCVLPRRIRPRAPAAAAVRERSFATSSATESLVEQRLAHAELARAREAQASPPVPVGEGEVLLYTAGASTKRTVLTSWIGAGTCSLYLGAAKGVELLSTSADAVLLSPTWTAVFATVAAATAFFATAVTRTCVRYAVLTADGAHLRVHAYGLGGIGSGKGISVPVPLLAVDVPYMERRKDGEALHVRVNGSKAPLVFDKPSGLGIPRSPGTGLVWDRDGLVSLVLGGAGEAGAPARPPVTSDALGLLDKDVRAALRRYAVLVHVLGGHPVDTARVRAGDFPLSALKTATKPTDAALRALWKSATDPTSGKTYYYHELTWQRQWTPPTVEGARAAGGVGAA
jgi:hypothetical protein